VSQTNRQVNSSRLIASINDAIRSGFGICPLLGSGISSASGIIMGRDFSDYLAYCVKSALEPSGRWDVRQDGWLPYPNPEEYEKARRWTLDAFSKICTANGYEIANGTSDDTIDGLMPITGSDHRIDFSVAKALNCPQVPANIRSHRFKHLDDSIAKLANSIRASHTTTEPYAPLWPRHEQSQSSRDWVVELGIRSLSDWRMTLHFLSRLQQVRNPNRTILGDPEGSVIDRFNTFITADKQPNLAHKMLATLARPLRMRTILTTNFDTLLEDAFLQQGHSLTKFFVSTYGKLPDPFVVRAQPSIIKLHGELQETRADLTLDDDPKRTDKESFLQYFFHVSTRRPKLLTTPAHLFVIGFSANDMRIVRLIQFMLDETEAYPPAIRPKIFWIGHSQRDVERIESLLPASVYQDRLLVHQSNRPDLLLLELYQRTTLSLPIAGHTYEYNHNVPPSRMKESEDGLQEGFDQKLDLRCEEVYFQDATIVDEMLKSGKSHSSLAQLFSARDCLARVAGHTLYARHQGQTIEPRDRFVDQLYVIHDLTSIKRINDQAGINRINDADWKGIHCDSNNILYFNTACGALESLSILHAKVLSQPGKNCLWFELADYIDTDSLLRDILRSIAIRTGRFQREHVLLHPLQEKMSTLQASDDAIREILLKYFETLCRVHHLSPSRWTIILYGRDVAGSCVSWDGSDWKAVDWKCLSLLIGALGQAGFHLVFAYPSKDRLTSEQAKQTKAIGKRTSSNIDLGHPLTTSEWRNFVGVDLPTTNQEATLATPVSADAFPETFTSLQQPNDALSAFQSMHDAVMKKCHSDPMFADFLYAVCLFRQSRRPSALFYEAVQPCSNRFNVYGVDNDLMRSQLATEWVSFLEQNRVFYKKAGGHSWMHRDIRITLRQSLDYHFRAREDRKSAFCHSLARSHFWIGDWYEKAFLATGFAKPMLECLHHRFQSAKASIYSIPSDLLDRREEKGAEQAIQRHRAMLFRYSVIAMTKSLIMSRQYLKLWLANIHGFGMFDQEASTSVLKVLRNISMQIEPKAKPADMDEILAEFETALVETDRSIRREADLAFSGYANPVSTQSTNKALKGNVRTQLDTVLGATYLAPEEWHDALKGLYQAAEAQFPEACIQLLRDSMPVTDATPLQRFDSNAYAKDKGESMDRLAKDFGNLLPLLFLIEGLAYAQLRRAKFRSHHAHGSAVRFASYQMKVRVEWLKVTRLCNLGIDWCKHLRVGSFQMECELRVRMHSYYAVALANLDRFFEAHRHINQANGINSKRDLPPSNVELAKLSIRRAEVLLTEAHRFSQVLELLRDPEKPWPKSEPPEPSEPPRNFRKVFAEEAPWCFENSLSESNEGPALPPSALPNSVQVYLHRSAIECIPDVTLTHKAHSDAIDSLIRLLVATLDDAWFTIENAERLLSGRSQSSLWWGRIALMKLRAFGYQSHVFGKNDFEEMRMLAYKHRRINPQGMLRIFDNAMLNNGGSTYRELRLIRYMAMCIVSFAKCGDDRELLAAMAVALEQKLNTAVKSGEMPKVYQLAWKGCQDALQATGCSHTTTETVPAKLDGAMVAPSENAAGEPTP
jgi:NAD-dependent SIR2 family protein deacetylase